MSILSHNGSAIIAMRGKNCAAIATDLRFGIQLQTISTNFDKIHQYGPHLFVAFPGLASDTLTVSQRLRFKTNLYELNENRPMRPKTMMNVLSNLLYERRFGTYFVEPIIVGLDPITDEPFVAGMDLIGCAMEAEDFAVGGTCTEQMFGMCETLWEKDMDSSQLFECISQALMSSLDRDCTSGWGVRVYLIEKEQVTISDLKTRMD